MATEDDLDILAWTMLGEAGGEGTQGMADVGHVILNRLNNGKYGASITDVAKSPKQFSTWNSGAGGNNPTGRFPKNSAEFKRAREIAAQVVAGTIAGPPGKPLDYNAPSVSPYWADSKSRHGTYERNGHVFYPSVPVPPGEIPNTVGTLTDTVPPAPPVPVSPMPSTAAMRGMTSPTGGNTDLQTALDQYATRERNRVIPQMPPVKSVQTIASIPTTPSRAFNGDPLTPARGDVVASIPTRAPSQSYAGQDTARPRFNGDPLTPARGKVVASIPTRPPVSRAPISYAGQDASPPRQALPTLDRTRTASLEPSSRIGMPPATRSVQSIPVPMQNALAAARAEQGIQRSVAPSMPRQFTPPSIPGPAPVAKTNDRLLASTGIDFVPAPSVRQPAQSGGLSRDAMERQRSYAQAQLTPGIPQPPTVRLPTLAAPMSLPTLEELTGATGFRVPMPAMPAAPRIAAPVPFPRPAFAAPRVAQAPVRRVAPVPMPLAARPVQRAPLSILVQGSNTIRPQQSLYYRDPRAFGNAATSQSGDTSVGSQADAAAARASGDSYRASRR